MQLETAWTDVTQPANISKINNHLQAKSTHYGMGNSLPLLWEVSITISTSNSCFFFNFPLFLTDLIFDDDNGTIHRRRINYSLVVALIAVLIALLALIVAIFAVTHLDNTQSPSPFTHTKQGICKFSFWTVPLDNFFSWRRVSDVFFWFRPPPGH